MLRKYLLHLRGRILLLQKFLKILIIYFHLPFTFRAVHQYCLLLLNLWKLLFWKLREISCSCCWRELGWTLWLSVETGESTTLLVEIWSCVRHNLVIHCSLLPLLTFYNLTLLLLWFKSSFLRLTHLYFWSHSLAASTRVVNTYSSWRQMMSWHLMVHTNCSYMRVLAWGMTKGWDLITCSTSVTFRWSGSLNFSSLLWAYSFTLLSDCTSLTMWSVLWQNSTVSMFDITNTEIMMLLIFLRIQNEIVLRVELFIKTFIMMSDIDMR